MPDAQNAWTRIRRGSEEVIVEKPRNEHCPRWVRALDAGGKVVVDSKRARYVREPGRMIDYAVPAEDVDASVRGQLSPSEMAPGHLLVKFRAFDTILEEDEVAIVHARDPYHRVDALPSRRVVEVRLDGELLARSTSPVLLFETSLPTRYYLSRADVRMELFTRSEKTSGCPYKGIAGYWHVDVGGRRSADLAWHYDHPFPAVDAIRGRVCFYNEKVDLTVDGEALERPQTAFS
jgi:uncharacterized protein (DUF427 family)